MPDISAIAVAVATLTAFVIGAAYYAVLGDQLATVSPAAEAAERPGALVLGVELGRCLVIALVVAGLAAEAGADALANGLLLGLALWIGFPLVLWIGAIVHEHTPVRLAAIHAGDWLVKLLAVGALIGILQ